MKKVLIDHPGMILAGFTIKTGFKNESNTNTSIIFNFINNYFQNNIAEQIPNRKNPGVTITAYTDYESNEYENYTYFVGEEVSDINPANVFNHLKYIQVPNGKYQKFTTEPGEIPSVVIKAWKEIWQMDEKNIGGQRAYLTDFEIYDHRAADNKAAIIDIYVGII